MKKVNFETFNVHTVNSFPTLKFKMNLWRVCNLEIFWTHQAPVVYILYIIRFRYIRLGDIKYTWQPKEKTNKIFFLFLAFFFFSSHFSLVVLDDVECLLLMDNALLAVHTLFSNNYGEERFRCPLCCNVQYTQVRFLRSHIKECGQLFFCEICKQNYKQKRTFNNHMRIKHAHHTTDTSFICRYKN